MVNCPLIRPFLGGVALGGVPLGSHDTSILGELFDLFHWSCVSGIFQGALACVKQALKKGGILPK